MRFFIWCSSPLFSQIIFLGLKMTRLNLLQERGTSETKLCISIVARVNKLMYVQPHGLEVNHYFFCRRLSI